MTSVKNVKELIGGSVGPLSGKRIVEIAGIGPAHFVPCYWLTLGAEVVRRSSISCP